jgi:hypothetical protein
MKKERKGEVTEKENHKGVGFRVRVRVRLSRQSRHAFLVKLYLILRPLPINPDVVQRARLTRPCSLGPGNLGRGCGEAWIARPGNRHMGRAGFRQSQGAAHLDVPVSDNLT